MLHIVPRGWRHARPKTQSFGCANS
jgi:hypothetical protein